MSYQVLARKWRPRTFKDMVGQEAILRMLTNALEQQRIHHAYLLTGTRGVGKTTLGRIMAKSLNCEKGISANPCGKCDTCKAIDSGQFLDLYEVDAASRTKVEDTRELLDNVLYPPTQGRYKIYLIDEVHMLSNHSFNALLKTLEEPPEHVKFILATTEPKKLPITILSRCLQFYLKHITPEQISKHLLHICKQEKIKAEEGGIQKIAKAANGSMRDALSLLDQAIAYGQGKVKEDEVNAMLGNMAQDEIIPFIVALSKQNGTKLLSLAKELAERTPHFKQVLDEMSNLFHHIAMAQIVPEVQSHDKFITELATHISPADVQVYYQICLLGKRDLDIAPTPQQGFEMVLLRLLAFNPGREAKPKPIKTTKSAAKQAQTTTITESDDWNTMLSKLGLSGMAHALAANCALQSIEGNRVTLALAASHETMLNPKLKERLAAAISKLLQKDTQLEINVTKEALSTPNKLAEKANNNKLQQAKTTAMQNPSVKKLIDMYDATVEVSLT